MRFPRHRRCGEWRRRDREQMLCVDPLDFYAAFFSDAGYFAETTRSRFFQ